MKIRETTFPINAFKWLPGFQLRPNIQSHTMKLPFPEDLAYKRVYLADEDKELYSEYMQLLMDLRLEVTNNIDKAVSIFG